MAVSASKTWITNESLTASDLNAEFSNIYSNGENLGWPATKLKDLDGQELVLDADGDTSITADTDDQIDFRLAGIDAFTMATVASAVNFLKLTAAATGNPVIISNDGEDDIGMEFHAKNGEEMLILAATAAAVNQITLTNAATGNGPIISASGETDVDLNINPKGTGVLKSGSSPVNIAGKQTIWVPAAAMQPTISNGCAGLVLVELTSGRPNLQVLDFATGADEHAQFQVAFPKSWNLGTVTYQAFWTSIATDTDGVSWALQGVSMPDNSTIDAAYGTPIVVDDANQSAANELLVTDESAAVTIDGTPADDDMCFFRVFRDVSDSNDVATEDARLIGVKLFFTTDAVNDA